MFDFVEVVLFYVFVFWYFNSCSFWFDQITTESNTAKCLCNRSAHTERWQLESNHINVLVWHKCLTQALHSPDESHDIWETMIYTTTNSFLFRSVIPPKMATTSASLTTTKLRALMIATDDQWDHLWHVYHRYHILEYTPQVPKHNKMKSNNSWITNTKPWRRYNWVL